MELEHNTDSDQRMYNLAQFEGPLDLLLSLIKKNEVNVYDIPIGDITEQYLDYLDYAVVTDLENLTEFYSLAAELLYIKSHLLLPIETNFDGDEMEDPRQELVDKLIEYQKFKKLSELIEEKEEETEWNVERKKIQNVLPFEEEELWEKIDTWTLMKTFTQLVGAHSGDKIMSMYEEISVGEKITLMNEFFENKGECFFTDLIIRKESIMDIVCAFMAILEAVKFHSACIYQNRMFGDIKILPLKAA